jgi:hypothetical protein
MTPEKVMEILQAHGTQVTVDEAKIILVYLTELAKLEVADFIGREKEKKFSTIDKNNCSA